MTKQTEIQKLIVELQTGKGRQRRAASYRLGKSKNPDAVPALIAAYSDDDVSVRQNVVDGLRRIRTDEAIDFLESRSILSTPLKVHFYQRPKVQFILGFVGWFIFSYVNNMGLMQFFGHGFDSFRFNESLIELLSTLQLIGVIFAATTFLLRIRTVGFGIFAVSILFTLGIFLRSTCARPGLPFPLSLIPGC